MNRLRISLAIPVAAAAGFSAGWFTLSAPPEQQPSGESGKPQAMAGAASSPATAAATEIPPLLSVEECREFLRLADTGFPGRHPLMIRSLKDYALRRWLELDAESALTAAELSPGAPEQATGFAADLFRVWLDFDTASAFDAWKQASPRLMAAVRVSFFTAWAEKDAAAARAALPAFPVRMLSDWWTGADHAIYAAWIRQDPRAAMEALPTSSSEPFETWLAADPAAAVAWAREGDGKTRYPDLSYPWLLQHDPAAAQAELNAAENPAVFASQAANRWASADPYGALRWAESQPAGSPFTREILYGAADEIAYADPALAAGVLQRLAESAAPDGKTPYSVKTSWRQIVASLSATDPDRALDLLNSQPAASRVDAFHGYFTYACAEDPQAAIAQSRAWLADPALKEDVLRALADSFRWGMGNGARDPSAMLAAVPELAPRIDADVLSGWSRANPQAAAEFITERAAAGHPIRGLQAEGVFAAIVIADPGWTSQWLLTLPDPALQAEAASTLTANWKNLDSEAAREWIGTLPEGSLRTAAEGGIAR